MKMGCSPPRGLFSDGLTVRLVLPNLKAIQDILSRYLEDEARFLEGVERGIQAAERGEFIEEEEMDVRVERMFKS